jgi:prepilin-type N-terminal cleavage/methylation domain-containing protein
LAQSRAGRWADAGFTLVEILGVVFVIGVLSAIALPVFLSQRGKAADAATQRDLIEVAKIVVSAFAEDPSAPTVRVVDGRYEVDGEEVGPASGSVTVAGADPVAVNTTGWTPAAWCMAFTNSAGHVRDYKFSAQWGLQPGSCASATAP